MASSSEQLKPDLVFYILTPFKIEAHEYGLSDFVADDLLQAIQSSSTLIATDQMCLDNLEKAYPTYHRYQIKVGKLQHAKR